MSTTGAAAAAVRLGTGEGAGEHMAVEAATTFDELFRRRYEPMVRVAFLLVGSRAEAEDVVQDSFARVELRWGRMDNPEGYLHRCVVNRSHDTLRRRRLEQRFGRLRRDETSELQADELGDALAALPAQTPGRRGAALLRRPPRTGDRRGPRGAPRDREVDVAPGSGPTPPGDRAMTTPPLEDRLTRLADGLVAPATPEARQAIGHRTGVLRRRRRAKRAVGSGVLVLAVIGGIALTRPDQNPEAEVGGSVAASGLHAGRPRVGDRGRPRTA